MAVAAINGKVERRKAGRDRGGWSTNWIMATLGPLFMRNAAGADFAASTGLRSPRAADANEGSCTKPLRPRANRGGPRVPMITKEEKMIAHYPLNPETDRAPAWTELIREALRIVEVIVTNGGMANKSAVEDVLMKKYPLLTRARAHDALNTIECRNLKTPDRRWNPHGAPTLEEYAPYIRRVEIRWYRGNPCD